MAISTCNDFTTRSWNDGWTDVTRSWPKGACFTCRCLLTACLLLFAYDLGQGGSLLFERTQAVLRRLFFFAWQASSRASMIDSNDIEEGTAVEKPDACCDCCTYCDSCSEKTQPKFRHPYLLWLRLSINVQI